MARSRVSAGLILTLGLMLSAVAFALWTLEVTVLDATRTADAASMVLHEAPVRQGMAERVGAALAADPSADPLAPVPTLPATRTVDQPEFETAFRAAVLEVHRHIFEGATGPIVLDPALVRQAAVVAGEPARNNAALKVTIAEESLPDLSRSVRALRMMVPVLAVLGLLMVGAGFLIDEHRPWALGRVGRWMLITGAGTAIVYWVLPRVVLLPMGGWGGVVGAITATGEFLLPIALILLVGGVAAIVGARRWEESARDRALALIPRAATRSTDPLPPWRGPV